VVGFPLKVVIRMEYDQTGNVLCHSHYDWSCRITDAKIYGSEALTLFPQDCRELGDLYEVALVGIVSREFAPRKVIERICSYEQINTAMLVDEIDLTEKTAFKIQLSAKHYKSENDILKLSSLFGVPVKFICFSGGHEVFTIKPRRPEQTKGFLNGLKRIGKLEKPAGDVQLLRGDPLEYFYYYLLHALGITDASQIQVFNALRNIVIADDSSSTDYIERYSRFFQTSPRSLIACFRKVYWKIVPVVAAINALNGRETPPLPHYSVENRSLGYIF
jgi:hypothetical protein